MFDKEYIFYGKHAMMVKRLTSKLSDQIGTSLFNTNYDVYRIAPVIGWVYNRKATIEKTGENTKIFADKMIREKDSTVFNYRTLMCLACSHMNLEEEQNIVFKLDDKDEERKPYDELFDAYVLGGVEVIYEKIFTGATTVEEYLMNMYEFLMELNVRFYGAE